VSKRLAHAATMILIAAAVVGCSAPPVPPPASPGVGLQATFVLANPAGLLALDSAGRSLGRIIDLPAQSAPATPVLHPSRKSIVFSLTQQPDPKTGFGSDLLTVNLDGSNLRALVKHEADNVFYASPHFDPTGDFLYFHRRAAIVRGGSYVGNEDSVERLDLRSGERKRVVNDGAVPNISPDGRRMVYLHLTHGQPDAVWTADADGANARPFLKTKDTWWYVHAAIFAPSGCEIVFSAAGHAVSGAPSTVARGAKAGLAHLNVPSFLYIAPCDGASVKSVGQTGDDVVPAWSPNGTEIAYVVSGAFVVLTLANGNIRTLAQGQDFFFGDLVWVK
jgi:Tol biopolymer transport system component